jgi:hypothetical protein
VARALLGLLALSVVLNAALLVAYTTSEGADHAHAAPAALAAPAAPAHVAADPAACAACESDLKQCQETSFQAVADAMERRAAEMFGDEADEEDEDDDATERRALRADAALQQDVLSQIAREHLRRHWEGTEEGILAGLRRDFADPGKQRQDLERDVGLLSGVLGLSGDRLGEFGDEYSKLRAARIEAARAAVTKEPPDWAGVLSAAKGLFADEDELAGKFGGDDGRERVRLSQVEKRTAILGIVATYAGDAWDDGIGW